MKVAINSSAWDALLHASPVVQAVLLLLIGLSIVSWAIIFSKRKQLQLVRYENSIFSDVFWKSPSLDVIHDQMANHTASPLAQVFIAGYNELQRLAEVSQKKLSQAKLPEGEILGVSTSTVEKNSQPQLLGIDNLHRSLRKAMDNELVLLETNLNFLATTSSNAPFIGLFGTVWGILTSFHQIGATGSANLAVVAPGISEALIATAIGLAAAIPAGAAYNYFLTRVKREELELQNFSSDFLNIAKRNFFKD